MLFYGEKGSVLFPGGDNYTVFDLKDNIIKEVSPEKTGDATNTVSPFENADQLHIRNFFDGIRNGSDKLAANIDSGHKSTLLVQLGNIAQRVGHSLDIDPSNGHIIKDKEASKLWSREYEKGWEMKL